MNIFFIPFLFFSSSYHLIEDLRHFTVLITEKQHVIALLLYPQKFCPWKLSTWHNDSCFLTSSIRCYMVQFITCSKEIVLDLGSWNKRTCTVFSYNSYKEMWQWLTVKVFWAAIANTGVRVGSKHNVLDVTHLFLTEFQGLSTGALLKMLNSTIFFSSQDEVNRQDFSLFADRAPTSQ